MDVDKEDDDHDDDDDDDRDDDEKNDPSFHEPKNQSQNPSSSRTNKRHAISISNTKTTKKHTSNKSISPMNVTPQQSKQVPSTKKQNIRSTKTKTTVKNIQPNARPRGTGNPSSSSSSSASITVQAKKVLDQYQQQHPEIMMTNATTVPLFISILKSIASMKSTKTTKKKNTTTVHDDSISSSSSSLSQECQEIIQTVVESFWNHIQEYQQHEDEDNDHDEMNYIMIHLYNLIFCSVGGISLFNDGSNSNNDTTEVMIVLENMTDDDWTKHIDIIVEEMSDNTITHPFIIKTSTSSTTPTILPSFSSTTILNNHLTGSSSNSSNLVFDNLYSEFWYQFTMKILTNYTLDSSKNSTDMNDDNTNNGRFHVEIIRQIVSRFMELVNIGVPDIRYAICIAIYQMGYAVLQYTVILQNKVNVAQRQYNVISKNKTNKQQKQKSNALQNQIQLWDRTIMDCMEIVKEYIVTSVFTIRYKDVHPMIRALSLYTLCQYSICRSDVLLTSFYLKYFGWMMSDKSSMVRIAAIYGLMKPLYLLQHENESNHTTMNHSTMVHTNIVTNMTSVITKFLTRMVNCVIDIDTSVQEIAIQFVLLLLRHYYDDHISHTLENDDNEHIWTQINIRAIDPQTTPIVRKYALYVVLEQLDIPTLSIDTPPQQSERDVVTHLYAIGKWYVP
jgi:hypothetical protein